MSNSSDETQQNKHNHIDPVFKEWEFKEHAYRVRPEVNRGHHDYNIVWMDSGVESD